MPRPLRLDPHGARVFEDWKRAAADEDVELVSEVLRTVAVDTWERRWHSQPDSGDPDITVLSPKDGLLVCVRFGGDGVFDLDYIGPHPDDWPEYR
jgi:hypothetical protein